MRGIAAGSWSQCLQQTGWKPVLLCSRCRGSAGAALDRARRGRDRVAQTLSPLLITAKTSWTKIFIGGVAIVAARQLHAYTLFNLRCCLPFPLRSQPVNGSVRRLRAGAADNCGCPLRRSRKALEVPGLASNPVSSIFCDIQLSFGFACTGANSCGRATQNCVENEGALSQTVESPWTPTGRGGDRVQLFGKERVQI